MFIGLEATLENQYRIPLEKFEKALLEFDNQRDQMSIAMRVLAVNVFLHSLFGFPYRHFLMPMRVLRLVQNKVSRFISRIPFAKLGVFCHLRGLYGLRIQLWDLRLANVASLLSSYFAQ